METIKKCKYILNRRIFCHGQLTFGLHFQCIEKLFFLGQFSRLFISNLPDVFVVLHACFIIIIFFSYYLIEDEKNTHFMGTKICYNNRSEFEIWNLYRYYRVYKRDTEVKRPWLHLIYEDGKKYWQLLH